MSGDILGNPKGPVVIGVCDVLSHAKNVGGLSQLFVKTTRRKHDSGLTGWFSAPDVLSEKLFTFTHMENKVLSFPPLMTVHLIGRISLAARVTWGDLSKLFH